MIKKLQTYAMVVVAALMFAAPVALSTGVASAACSSTASQISKGANGAATGNSSSTGCADTNVSDASISAAAHDIVNTFSVIVGIISVIMIIYGGFRYITSGGDSGRVGNAKNTLIYAIIGLVVVALAQLIVQFVLAQSANVTT